MDLSAGTARPIVRYGAAVLHRPCARVDSFGADLEALVEDMFASMYAANGVGLGRCLVPRRRGERHGRQLAQLIRQTASGRGRERTGHGYEREPPGTVRPG